MAAKATKKKQKKKRKPRGKSKKIPMSKLPPVKIGEGSGAPKNKRKSGGRGVYRRAEEDIPGPDYIERMLKLGPRDGESFIAFRRRLASILEGRNLWLRVAKDCEGNVAECARRLGVQPSNAKLSLLPLGLTYRDIHKVGVIAKREREAEKAGKGATPKAESAPPSVENAVEEDTGADVSAPHPSPGLSPWADTDADTDATEEEK